MALSGADVQYLKNIDGNFFKLIKTLWMSASDSSNWHAIRRNYGVSNISHVLSYENPFAVKAATSILLFLSLSDSVDDFRSDVFYNNYLAAIENRNNEGNYVILGRLLRLLQTNKSFGDWMLSKGLNPRENKVWKRLYDLSKSDNMSEEIKKETSRATKEGMRVNAKEGEFCIIPERVVDKMKRETVWRITDADIDELNELSTVGGSSSQSPNVNSNTLERKLQEEKDEKQRAVDEINRIHEELDAARAELTQTKSDLQLKQSQAQNRDFRLNPPAAEYERGLVNGSAEIQGERNRLLRSLSTLTAELRDFKRQNADKEVESRALQAKVSELQQSVGYLKPEVCSCVRESLQSMQTALVEALRRASSQAQAQVQAQAQAQTQAQAQAQAQGQQVAFQPKISPPNPSSNYAYGPPSLSNSQSTLNNSQRFLPPTADDLPLPVGWEKKLDPNTNRYYYFERATKRTTWKPPMA